MGTAAKGCCPARRRAAHSACFQYRAVTRDWRTGHGDRRKDWATAGVASLRPRVAREDRPGDRLRCALLESVDERQQSWLLESVEAFLSTPFQSEWMPLVSESSYFRHLVETVRALGMHGECVIVGRGAAFILPSETTLRVRLVAPVRERIAALSRIDGITEREAAQRVRTIDRERNDFIRDSCSIMFYCVLLHPYVAVNVRTFLVLSAVAIAPPTATRGEPRVFCRCRSQTTCPTRLASGDRPARASIASDCGTPDIEKRAQTRPLLRPWWSVTFAVTRRKHKLLDDSSMPRFIALPVAQGDAFYLERLDFTVLVDGGRSRTTLPAIFQTVTDAPNSFRSQVRPKRRLVGVRAPRTS